MAQSAGNFTRALRPFSLVVAAATCGLGVSVALLTDRGTTALAALVLLAGICMQAGANLINDHADLERLQWRDSERRAIRRNARLGALAIALACLIGFWLVYLRGWPLLLLGVIGVIGAWGYAENPINLKSRGLGLPAVFLLTGLLMVEGAYYAMVGSFSAELAVMALPFSMFASLLLLGNELRDYESDREEGHRTFTVRFGYGAGAWLYRGLGLGLALCTLALAVLLDNRAMLLPLLALSLLWVPLRLLPRPTRERVRLAQFTGRCYFAYALCFVAAIWMHEL